jgi:hypothetical protein
MSFFDPYHRQRLAEMKARQAAKLRELKEALIAAGMTSLDEQAEALGLGRSTAWTILRGNHKASGLSARTINRMLAAPGMSPQVRAKILEYVKEKAIGEYGHGEIRRRRFVARLSFKPKGLSSNVNGTMGQSATPAFGTKSRRRPT